MFGKKRYFVAVILPLLIFLCCCIPLAGCGSGEGGPSGGTAARVVVDQLGREVELPAKVERVVTNYPMATQIIYALGAGESLVGCENNAQRADFLARIDAAFTELPEVGSPNEINVETTLSLNPDVVIVRCSISAEQVENLESLGIKVLGMDCEDLDRLSGAVEMMGKTLGCEEKAGEYIRYYREQREFIEQSLAHLQEDDRVSVYLNRGNMNTFGGDVYQSDVLRLCGGRNVAEDLSGWASTSKEQLLLWNPEYIMVLSYSSDTPQSVLADPDLAPLKAVKEGHVLWFPSELASWDYPSMQAVLGLLWCAKTLHPDRFEDVDLLEYADSYFVKFFGKSFTELGGSL